MSRDATVFRPWAAKHRSENSRALLSKLTFDNIISSLSAVRVRNSDRIRMPSLGLSIICPRCGNKPFSKWRIPKNIKRFFSSKNSSRNRRKLPNFWHFDRKKFWRFFWVNMSNFATFPYTKNAKFGHFWKVWKKMLKFCRIWQLFRQKLWKLGELFLAKFGIFWGKV